LFYPKSDAPSKQRLPTSYVFELLTIHRWEEWKKHAGRTCDPDKFSVRGAFKDVMTQLVNFGDIDAHWTDYYTLSEFSLASRKEPRK